MEQCPRVEKGWNLVCKWRDCFKSIGYSSVIIGRKIGMREQTVEMGVNVLVEICGSSRGLQRGEKKNI